MNAEIQRGRAIAGGHPAAEEPYLELRDSSKIKQRDDLSDDMPGHRLGTTTASRRSGGR